MQGILTITTDKLIPTKDVKNSSFNPELKNGVDISIIMPDFMLIMTLNFT